MKKVFVCSPYGGDIEGNTKRAIESCRREIEEGNVPYAPHLFFPQILDERNPGDRELGIRLGLEMMDRCDEVHAYGTHISPGMFLEVEYAKRTGKRVEYMDIGKMAEAK